MNKALQVIKVDRPLMGPASIDKPSYVIKFRGDVYCELYFNMTGYVTDKGLPMPRPECPNGIGFIGVGEKSLSVIKTYIADLNREWANADSGT